MDASETDESSVTRSTAGKGEVFSWAMYDFANSAYTTVVATTMFNPYFVKVVAGPASGLPAGQGTLVLTIGICLSSTFIVLTAPIIGTIGDALACKKKLLLAMTILCVATGLGRTIGPRNSLIALVGLIGAYGSYKAVEYYRTNSYHRALRGIFQKWSGSIQTHSRAQTLLTAIEKYGDPTNFRCHYCLPLCKRSRG